MIYSAILDFIINYKRTTMTIAKIINLQKPKMISLKAGIKSYNITIVCTLHV